MEKNEIKKLIKKEIVPYLVGIRNEIADKPKDFLEENEIKGVIFKGEKGDKGETPVKDKDYPSIETVKDWVIQSTPKKYKDFFTKEDQDNIIKDIMSLMPTKDELKGQDGKDAVVDYDNVKLIAKELVNHQVKEIKNSINSQLKELEELVIKLEKNTKVSKITATQVRDLLESLKGDQRLRASSIKGLDEYIQTIIIQNSSGGSGTTASGGGYSNLTEFVDQTAWRLFYSNGDGDVQELALGASGTFLKSNGATSAPSFDTPSGSGDMLASVYDPNTIQADVFARANHTGTQTASTISDFDTEVSNNTDVSANTSARHSAVTLAGLYDYLTLSGQQITLNQIDLTTDVTGDLPFANIAQIATNRILGRSTAGTGDIESLTGSAVRGIIGLDTTDSPQFTAINLGHATDTTISRVSAGIIAVEGTQVALFGDNISNFTNDSGYITATLTQEQVEDYAGSLIATGGTKTRIAVTYQDATGDVDFVVDGDLHNYSWANVDSTDLKVGSVTQAHSSVLDNTTASFTTAQETKLGYISVTQAVDLDAIETRVNELDASVVLKGTWDASVGTFPTSSNAGESWIVSVGGTVDSIEFTANDRIVAITDSASTTTYSGNWHKLDYTDAVLSVAGQTGAVTLDTDDVSEGTNLYFTDERAQDAIGTILVDSSEIDFTYSDATPSITASIVTGSIDVLKLDSGVQTSLGLADSSLQSSDIGVSVQAYDAGLTSIAGLTTSANKMIYTTASDTYAVTDLSAFARTILDDADAGTVRATLGLGSLATLSDLSTFDTDDLAEGATNKYNATHTGEVTGATSLTLDKTAITGKTEAVITASDYILFSDTDDTGNLKKDTVQGILDLVSGGVSDGDKGDITVSGSGTVWSIDAGVVDAPEMANDMKYETIGIVVDGGGSAITTGVKGYRYIPYDCTIQSVEIVADQTGSIVFDLWVDTYANFPPVDADSITASAQPTLSSAVKSQDATLTGWTTALTRGSYIGFNVDSASTVTRVTLTLTVLRT